MTEDTSRKVANLVLAGVAMGAAYYVVKTPQLRRLAWRLALTGLTGALPAWASRELQQAWAESGRRAI